MRREHGHVIASHGCRWTFSRSDHHHRKCRKFLFLFSCLPASSIVTKLPLYMLPNYQQGSDTIFGPPPRKKNPSRVSPRVTRNAALQLSLDSFREHATGKKTDPGLAVAQSCSDAPERPDPSSKGGRAESATKKNTRGTTKKMPTTHTSKEERAHSEDPPSPSPSPPP